jgi:peptidyl-prolyl cis-trans isomerase SurA
MNSIKLLIIFLLLLNLSTNISNSLENKIILKIDRDIVTTLDVKEEAKYLSALNPRLLELKDKKIFEISKNSLIREKIKEIEILKNRKDTNLSDNILEKIIETRYKSLGLETKEQFLSYLKDSNIEIDTVINKIKIEALWNQLIVYKFSSKIKIDKNKLRENISLNKSAAETKEFLLKEIVFNIDQDLNLEEKYRVIKESIKKTGFENTASIYSISDTAKVGGMLGWVNENSLNPKIKNVISKLKLSEYSEPIILPGGFLILQISDIKIIKEKFDINKELDIAVNTESNRQLNQFSNIYFNKIKKEISIDEI